MIITAKSMLSHGVNPPMFTANYLKDDGVFPNNNKLPVLFYESAIAQEDDPAAFIESLFAENNWGNAWRDGVFDYHHYHSSAHEALACYIGSAELRLGGPTGLIFGLEAGDVLIIPAGVAHRKVSSSSDFSVVGAYPADQNFDLCRGAPEERPRADRNIARVHLPDFDPVYGEDGPMMRKWVS